MTAVYGRWTIRWIGLTQNCDGWGGEETVDPLGLPLGLSRGRATQGLLQCYHSLFVSCVIHDGSKRSAVKSARGRSNRSSNGPTPPPTAFTKTPSTPSNPSPCTLAPPTCVSTRPGDNRARSCGWSAACVPGRACDKSSAIIAGNYYPQLSAITRNYEGLTSVTVTTTGRPSSTCFALK